MPRHIVPTLTLVLVGSLLLSLSQAQCPTYTVRIGDTFSTIAAAQGVSSSALQSANPGVSATNLQIGQSLSLPCSSGSGTSSSSPSTTSSSSAVTISASQFSQALTASGFSPVADSVRTGMLDAITKLGGSSVISSTRELAMLMAQSLHETGGFQQLTEAGCATEFPFCGRGYLQLTGRNNYAAASQAILQNNNFVNTPSLVAQSPYAWQSAMWYWSTNVHSKVQSGSFGAATKAINGALECGSSPSNPTGAASRCKYYKAILPILSPGSTADCSGC